MIFIIRNMKRLRQMIIPGLMLIALACNDPLTEEAEDFIALEQLDVVSAEALVKGIYRPLVQSSGSRSIYFRELVLQIEVKTDYAYGRGSYDPAGKYSLDANNIGRIGNVWLPLYDGVNRANSVIAALENTPDEVIDPETRNRLSGEARFLRAVYYFNLVRLWGGVPLKTTAAADLGNTGAVRASVDEVYSQIIADLQFAEQHLNISQPADDRGRATTGAAKVMLADVYLTRQDYQNARDKAREVIDMNQYTLSANFADVFDVGNSTTDEDIFSVHFINVPGFGNFLGASFHISNDTGWAGQGFQVTPGNENSFLSTWDDNDLRKDWTMYTEYVSTNTGAIKQNADRFGFPIAFRKFRDPNSVGSNDQANNFPIYRYAEVLLILAESENMLNGPNSAAYEAVNQVRRRGYGLDINSSSALADLPAGLSAEEFDQAVFDERGYEFVTEGKRWFDLVRTGRAADLLTATKTDASFTAPRDLLWPIPIAEIDGNDLLSESDQNPGY